MRTIQTKPKAVVVALALDGLALALLLTFFVILATSDREPLRDQEFFAEPLYAALVLAAAVSGLAGGVIATASLLRTAPRTRQGRWAVRLAVVNALITPVVAAVVATIAWLAGFDLPDGWGQPIAPIWLATGVSALVLGVTAKEPGRRSLLVIPVMIGASVATFAGGEIIGH
jgi:hypothetical protein